MRPRTCQRCGGTKMVGQPLAGWPENTVWRVCPDCASTSPPSADVGSDNALRAKALDVLLAWERQEATLDLCVRNGWPAIECDSLRDAIRALRGAL